MENLQKKIDLLVALALAEHGTQRESIKQELLKMTPQTDPVAVRPRTVKEEAQNLLRELGVPCSLAGYEPTVIALCFLVDDPSLRGRFTKVLYPMIADEIADNYNVCRVERNIRHAIETAWDRGDLDVFDKYFGNTLSRSKGKPTNREFLMQVANIIRRRMGEKQ